MVNWVQKIKEHSDVNQQNYEKGKDNPADDASRGLFFLFEQKTNLNTELTQKLRKYKIGYNKTNSQQNQM